MSVEDYFSSKQVDSITNSIAKINIWQGAVSSGKTYASLWRWYDECRSGPPGPFAMLSKTYDTFKRNILPELEKILGSHIRYSQGKREMTVKNRLVHVIGCSDERAEQKIRGQTLAGAYVDEATLIPESAFRMLQSRLRVPGAKLFCTTNPDSPYHWFKRDFLDNNQDVAQWHFLMDDNPYLSSDYIQYIKRQYHGLWYKRYVEGLWVQAEGAIYDFFDERFHVINFPPGMAESYICGVDYGTSNPCSFILIGINRSKYPNMWVEREYFFDSRKEQRQKTDSEYAEDLYSFLANLPCEAVYIDPSAVSFRVELQKRGGLNVIEAKNEVIDGIRLVSTYLSNGTLKICSNCQETIKEIQSYVWDVKSEKSGQDKPKKTDDHSLDALRYAIFSHFFHKDFNLLKPQDVDRNYREAMSSGPDLPGPFRSVSF